MAFDSRPAAANQISFPWLIVLESIFPGWPGVVDKPPSSASPLRNVKVLGSPHELGFFAQ